MYILGSHNICKRCLCSLQSMRIHQRLKYTNTQNITWKSKDVRKAFLDFFCGRYKHRFVPSSQVIPKKGEGTYFTNAGMNQFKPIFLGTVQDSSEMSTYLRVANSQKCVRVGGKHNDLEDVGRDLTHHTFFEMLGSWSFGDYFKREACEMALQLLTEVYRLPIDRLYFTYYQDVDSTLEADLECREIWRSLGIPDSRILPFGGQDNFWDMGDVGPCGRCTEIHYDHIGGRDAGQLVNQGSAEVVEIWNLVFMEFDRQKSGDLMPLPLPHVDTGMGLERLCAVLTSTCSNYDTDLFLPIFRTLQMLSGAPGYTGYVGTADNQGIDQAYRTVADHIRMMTVCISDGLMPGRDDLDLRLRTVMNRCVLQYHNILHGKPGQLAQLVDPVVESLGESFPEVQTKCQIVKDVINHTEEKYLRTLKDGRKTFQKFMKTKSGIKELKGKDVFDLVDGQYGSQVPVEVVSAMSSQHQLTVNWDNFHTIVQERNVKSVKVDTHQAGLVEITKKLVSTGVPETDDTPKYLYSQTPGGQTPGGYDFPVCTGEILAALSGSDLKDSVVVTDDQQVSVVLNQTPFYAEAGGQASDTGHIKSETGEMVVMDTQCHHGYIIHSGYMASGYLSAGQAVQSIIDQDVREAHMRGHTATHLLNAELRQHVPNVKQRGSSITSNKLVFEFSAVTKVTKQILEMVEAGIRHAIKAQIPVNRRQIPVKEAFNLDGVVYLEDEVYPSEVYVVSIDGTSADQQRFSKSVELCGGTHVVNTADIGDICVVGVAGVDQGTKKITCLTGQEASRVVSCGDHLMSECRKLEELVTQNREQEKWQNIHSYITKMLGGEDVPKLVRDDILQTLKQLNKKLNQANAAQIKDTLKQDILEMAAKQSYVILQTDIKKWKKAASLLKTMDIPVPVVLVLDLGGKTVALVALPKGYSVSVEDVCDRLGETLGEQTIVTMDTSVGVVKKFPAEQTQFVLNTAKHVVEQLLE